jgi:hypothetical protein
MAFSSLVSTIWPLWRAWRVLGPTALRSTWCWIAFGTLFWTLEAGLSLLEPEPGAWVRLGFLRLTCATLALAPLAAVLGARWPGELAWNLIVLSLLVVFMLPVMEQGLLGKMIDKGRPGMDGPRFFFYWGLATVGIVNYVPTRFGFAMILFGTGLAAQSAAVGPWTIGSPAVVSILSSIACLIASGAAWLALLQRPRANAVGIEQAWLSLRDRWGLVWALRVRDRWNTAAKHYDWPVRLNWGGFSRVPGASVPSTHEMEAGEHQFRLLLKRFADPEIWVQGSGFRVQK